MKAYMENEFHDGYSCPPCGEYFDYKIFATGSKEY